MKFCLSKKAKGTDVIATEKLLSCSEAGSLRAKGHEYSGARAGAGEMGCSLAEEARVPYGTAPKSSSEWRTIWLSKLSRILAEREIELDCRKAFGDVVCRYLTRNPWPPYHIRVDRLHGFLQGAPKETFRALHFFYSFVAPSREHLDTILAQARAQASRVCGESRDPQTGTTVVSRPVDNVERRFGSKPSGTNREKSRGEPIVPIVQVKREKPSATCLESERLLERLREEVRVRDYSGSTLKNYHQAVSIFLDRLTPEASKNWSHAFKEHLIWLRDTRGYAATTVNNHASSIKFFFLEVLQVHPGEDIYLRMKTGKQLPRVHSREEIGKILGGTQNLKHRLILILTYGCGLRLGEIQNLRPRDIDLNRRVLTIRNGKGKKDRIVMIDRDLLPIIDDWVRTGCGKEYLFEGMHSGQPLSKRSIQKIYANSCEKHQIDRRGGIHSLRHSFATHLLEQGVDLRYIQELLGHKSSKTTEIYTHVAANKILEIRSPVAGLIGPHREPLVRPTDQPPPV